MKTVTKRNILLTLIGSGTVISAAVIIAALASDSNGYNKKEHNIAKQKLEIANDSYALTHRIAAKTADSIVWANPKNRHLVVELNYIVNAMHSCGNRCDSIQDQFEAVMQKFDDLTGIEMSRDAGLAAATDEMAAARAVVEKYERDSVAYEQWRKQPLKKRVAGGLTRIFAAHKQNSK